MNTPTDIAQQALDAAACDVVLGDISEGTREAQVVLRAYGQCLRQLLRAVHWNFARKTAPLTLLADATGQTPNVGTQTISPWVYEYSYPTDCMKARFVPWNWQGINPGVPTGNIQPANPSLPTVSGLNQPPLMGGQLRPARFLEAVDPNYPSPVGTITWEVQGVSPQGRTVICTNVQNASLVYTALMNYPSNWDAQFRAAMVSYLASEVALPLSRDKKFGLTLRAQNIAIVKSKVSEARATNANENWNNQDLSVDWMRTRNIGGGRGWGSNWEGSGPGILYGGLDGCCGVGNTAAY